MKVVLAESAGFCAGVKTAMRLAVDAAGRQGGLRSLGPLIHNDQAVRLLALRGVTASDAEPVVGEHILIRAHGVRPDDRRRWQERGCSLVDATCVHVARNQRLAAEAAAAGKTVVIAGDAGHAEVQAVMGAAGSGALVVSDVADVEKLELSSPLFLLAQTTFEVERFQRIAAVAAKRFPDADIRNTICRATERRQKEARQLAARVDAVVVVGGKHSANTRRLAEAAGESGKPVVLVETAAELDPAAFTGCAIVGVTAGASTPGWITQAVVDALRRMGSPSLAGKINSLLYVLLESRALTALSAAGFALAAQFLAGVGFNAGLAAAAGLYVFFAHLVNRRVPDDPELRILSGVDPFYNRHRSPLLASAWLAAVLSLLLAWRGGAAWLYLAALAAALAHSRLVVQTMPLAARFKGMVGARAALISLAWALTTAGPPALAVAGAGRALAGLAVVVFVFLLCFGKTLVRDLYDLDGDHLMGLETLALSLGPRKASRLAVLVAGTAAAIPLLMASASAVAGEWSGRRIVFAFALAALAVSEAFLIGRDGRRRIADPLHFLAALEAVGCLAGAFALACGV